jgi:NAD(P)H-flavin reductase
VDDILERHLGGRVAVLACGPDGMMDDMRAAVAAAYDRVGGDQLEYFEEAFSW